MAVTSSTPRSSRVPTDRLIDFGETPIEVAGVGDARALEKFDNVQDLDDQKGKSQVKLKDLRRRSIGTNVRQRYLARAVRKRIVNVTPGAEVLPSSAAERVTAEQFVISSETVYQDIGESEVGVGSIEATNTVKDTVPAEEVMESVFRECDPMESGRVPIARLVAYIISKQEGDERPFVDELRTLLDPLSTGPDSSVDLESYRQAVRDWLQKIQPPSLNVSQRDPAARLSSSCPILSSPANVQEDLKTSRSTCKRNLFSTFSSPSSLGLLDISAMSSYTYGSLEAIGGDSSKMDPVELTSQISELQFQLQRVTEKNADLQKQLLSAEDVQSHLVAERDEVRKKLHSLQSESDKIKTKEKECEDLKQALHFLEEDIVTHRSTSSQLEKENASLEGELTQLRKEVQDIQNDVEVQKGREAEVNTALGNCRVELEALKKSNHLLEIQYQEQVLKTESLETMCSDLRHALEHAEKQKGELEVKWNKYQDEMNSTQEQYSLGALLNLRSPSAMDVEEDSDEEVVSNSFGNYEIPSSFASPFRRTSFESRDSIHDEIKALEELAEGPQFPLCGIDASKKGKDGDSHPTNEENKDQLQSCFQRLFDAVDSLRRKKHSGSEVSLLDNAELTKLLEDNTTRPILAKLIDEDMNNQTDSSQCEYQAPGSELPSMDGIKDLPVVEAKYKELVQEVEEQRNKITELQLQLASTEKELESSRSFEVSFLHCFQDVRNEFISEVNHLQSATAAVVAEKCVTGSEKMTRGGDDDATGKEGEDGWCNILLTDLDVDGTDQKEVTPERLRNQVSRELTALRSQIARSQAALAALARSSDVLGPPSAKDQSSETSHPPSLDPDESASPGHIQPNSRHEDTTQPRSSLGSSGEGHQLARSCPAIVSHVTTGTQTEFSEMPAQKTASAEDVIQEEPSSPQRARSSSYISAMEKRRIFEDEIAYADEHEDEFRQCASMFEPRGDGLDLDDYRPECEEDGDSVRDKHANQDEDNTQSPEGVSDSSFNAKIRPRLRQRSIPGSPVAAIQRSVAVDFDETEDDTKHEAETEAPASNSIPVFPSLPESFLKKLGLLRESPASDALSDQDIETRFTSLSLAFKTDRLTLDSRLELQQRQRDLVEKNITDELCRIKASINTLSPLCITAESSDLLSRIQRQMDTLQNMTERVSSAAEMYGAVQQENRVARAIEVMLLHVENLKRSFEKEHHELEETKRILMDNNIVLEEGVEVLEDGPLRGTPRYRAAAVFGAGVRAEARGKVVGLRTGRRASITSLKLSPSLQAEGSTSSVTANDSSNEKTDSPVSTQEYEERRSSPHSDLWPLEEKQNLSPSINGGVHSWPGGDRIPDSFGGIENLYAESDEYDQPSDISEMASSADDSVPLLLSFTSPAQALQQLSISEYATRGYQAAREFSWPWTMQQTIMGARYCLTAVLLFAALVSIVCTCVPTSAQPRQVVRVQWNKVADVVEPYLNLRHDRRPPT